LPRLALNHDSPDLSLQVARITGVSYRDPAPLQILNFITLLSTEASVLSANSSVPAVPHTDSVHLQFSLHSFLLDP
jgi:hypothetical protein